MTGAPKDFGRRGREITGVSPSNVDPLTLARARPVAAALDRILGGEAATRGDALALMRCAAGDLDALCAAARTLRARGRGRTVSFSPKVFIPLTRLCRDTCGYCTFRTDPHADPRLYMTPEEVLKVARAGERLGCSEALFTLGERPEQRFPEAREWLRRRGHRSTLSYLREAAEAVLRETALWPHLNPGTMSRDEMAPLRDVSVSMGLMLENTSERLCGPGGPHEHAPSKRPRARLRTMEAAGALRVPFTTGLLIGIGETPDERVDTLLAIRESHARWGHIQEVIVQNFRAKPATPMAGADEPDAVDVMRTAAVARLVLGAEMNIQVPPNLTARGYETYLGAGINDWGGISPLTIDYVNPEAPWPQITALRAKTEAAGLTLRPRLAVYPEYVLRRPDYLAPALIGRLRAAADADGYFKGGLLDDGHRHGRASA
ncbi:MAG TPA: 7,8-didemethyl-8-hydroxy-5-deazariboflavin synthase CofG [bacterium]|nr:7,8-didemethyl-8-hydroxy-5-deazariboflavin synthase CofG [bacterium]